ncbi:MAG: OmpA family protein [Gemmatimonadota bacterium]|nr:OmpA family protein [Gemmatimonadota bacterium]MDH5758654.1 OmpA family protein [Gemmatimonadota bacterium]
MMGFSKTPRSLAVLVVAGLVAGCASVKQEDLDSQLEQLRDEMSQQIADGDNGVTSRVDALSRRVDALERALADLQGEVGGSMERFESAIRFNAPVYFEFDRAELDENDTRILDRFASVVSQYYPTATITAEGFADPAGGSDYNVRLGQRRADAVRGYLTTRGGLSADQVRAVSYGENTPRIIVPGTHGPGADGWENRRVALVIDHLTL